MFWGEEIRPLRFLGIIDPALVLGNAGVVGTDVEKIGQTVQRGQVGNAGAAEIHRGQFRQGTNAADVIQVRALGDGQGGKPSALPEGLPVLQIQAQLLQGGGRPVGRESPTVQVRDWVTFSGCSSVRAAGTLRRR